MNDEKREEAKQGDSQETLVSAARRAVRFFNIDNTRGGGLISNETSSAMETLDRMWRKEVERQKS